MLDLYFSHIDYAIPFGFGTLDGNHLIEEKDKFGFEFLADIERAHGRSSSLSNFCTRSTLEDARWQRHQVPK